MVGRTAGYYILKYVEIAQDFLKIAGKLIFW